MLREITIAQPAGKRSLTDFWLLIVYIQRFLAVFHFVVLKALTAEYECIYECAGVYTQRILAHKTIYCPDYSVCVQECYGKLSTLSVYSYL